ncbi:hypothetical protein [Chryseobacterium sp. POE27]|uniref:beta strand repeat-containing protein n=1 Tax=Chryseobacterium sp. POE27 TaxID=3138177 RepID=UPI0032197280
MKKQTTFIIALVTSQFAFSQVGVNNTSPQATLDVTAKTTNGSKPEGFIAPRLTGDQIKSADTRYGTAQTGTIIYATSAVSSPVVGSKTEFITATGYYFYDGSKWQKLSGSGSGGGYLGSTSVTLNGTSFERAALTGDVTASANSNATTVAKIQGKSVASTAPTNGQVLKYNTTTSSWEPSSDAGLTSEVDGIIGNEVTSATTNGGLSVSGSGTAASPYTLGLPTTGVTTGQIMKWDGTKWALASDTDTNTTYTGSTSVTLNGTSFERPALTGDVTASANSNATTVAKIQGKSVSTTAPTNGQVLKYNTTTSAWEPAADTDTNTTYTGSTSVTLNGTSFERPALTGDVTASANSNATTVAKIQGKSVSTTAPTNGQVLKYNTTTSAWEPSSDAGLTSEVDGIIGNEVTSATTNGGLSVSGSGTAASPYTLGLPTTGVTTGQIMKWDGTKWALASDTDTNTTYTGSTSVTLNGTSFERPALTGDVTASANSNATTVAKIQGKSVSTTAPTNGQVLKYNTTTSAWEPAADTDTNTTYTGSTSVTLNGTSFERPALTGDVTASANSNATTVAKIQGKSVASTSPTNGQVLKYNTTTSSWEPSSDAGLTSEVDGIIGNEVKSATTNGGLSVSGSGTAASPYTLGLPTTGVTTGQIMKWDGTKWALGSDTDTNTTYTGSTSVTLNGTAFERPALTGDVTASANSNATTVAKIQGKSVSTTAPTNGQVLKYNTTTSAWEPAADTDTNTTYTGSTSVTLNGTAFERPALTGDVTASANSNATTVAKIQGKSVSTTAPTNGQVLKYNTATSAWEPAADVGTTYTGSTSVTLNGTSFERPALTGDVTASANSNATTVAKIQGKSVSTTAPTNGQVLKYNTTTSAWEPAADTDTNTTYTGSTSVTLNGTSFERPALTGDVTASANSNATTVAKIQGKSVSTTAPTNGQVLKYNTTTSAWEPAADTDTNTTYTGSTSVTLNGTSFERPALTGDVTASANSNATTVAKIQGKSVASTAPTNGQVLKYNTATSAWEPAADVGTTYTGSTSVTLNGTSFERPALTGDVTASANSNATTVAKIQGTAVSSSAPTTAGESLIYNGTSWGPSSNTLTVSPEVTTGTYTVKATDFFLRLNPTAAIIYINLPSTGIPVGKVIHIVNKGNKQANFLWDNVAPSGTLFYDQARPAVLGGGYSGTLVYLGGTGQGAWSFVVTY